MKQCPYIRSLCVMNPTIKTLYKFCLEDYRRCSQFKHLSDWGRSFADFIRHSAQLEHITEEEMLRRVRVGL